MFATSQKTIMLGAIASMVRGRAQCRYMRVYLGGGLSLLRHFIMSIFFDASFGSLLKYLPGPETHCFALAYLSVKAMRSEFYYVYFKFVVYVSMNAF